MVTVRTLTGKQIQAEIVGRGSAAREARAAKKLKPGTLYIYVRDDESGRLWTAATPRNWLDVLPVMDRLARTLRSWRRPQPDYIAYSHFEGAAFFEWLHGLCQRGDCDIFEDGSVTYPNVAWWLGEARAAGLLGSSGTRQAASKL